MEVQFNDLQIRVKLNAASIDCLLMCARLQYLVRLVGDAIHGSLTPHQQAQRAQASGQRPERPADLRFLAFQQLVRGYRRRLDGLMP